MNKHREVLQIIVFWMLVVLATLLLTPQVRAQDHTCQGGHNCNDAGANDVSINDGSRAISIGGSDYDIGRGSCKFHVGGFTVTIAQTDEFCEGMEMIRSGMVDAGVLHLCKQSNIGKNYASLQDCKDGVAVMAAGTGTTNGDDDAADDEDEYRERQQARMAEFESRVASVESERKASVRAAAIVRNKRQAYLQQKAAEVEELVDER